MQGAVQNCLTKSKEKEQKDSFPDCEDWEKKT